MTYKPTIPECDQFFMVFPAQLTVARHLISNAPDAAMAYAVFMYALCDVEKDTGVIRIDKRQLATKLAMPQEHIDTAMAFLRIVGIFYTAQDGWKVFDKLCFNPHLAWKGDKPTRQARRRLTAPLRLAKLPPSSTACWRSISCPRISLACSLVIAALSSSLPAACADWPKRTAVFGMTAGRGRPSGFTATFLPG